MKLPEDYIVDYELTSGQERILVENGKTLVKFYYNTTCPICLEQKTFLENTAEQFKDQIVLEEILVNRTDKILPYLIVISLYQERMLKNATNDEIIDLLCDSMVQPPVICAVRKV
jgi:thiol-disulfide isomerase/thioredoxin